jgi:hypothetical protein
MSQTGSFALDLAAFAQQTKDAIDETLQEVVIEIGNSVIRMSPVDTGRFRGNWQFSISSPATGTLDALDKGGGDTAARIAGDALFFKAGETAYIVNNLPYAVRLEYGHSDQAPGGMVRITLARFQAIIEETIRNNRL